MAPRRGAVKAVKPLGDRNPHCIAQSEPDTPEAASPVPSDVKTETGNTAETNMDPPKLPVGAVRRDENNEIRDSASDRSSSPDEKPSSEIITPSSSRPISPDTDSNLSFATDTTIKNVDLDRNLDVKLEFDEDSNSVFAPTPQFSKEPSPASSEASDKAAALVKLTQEQDQIQDRLKKLEQLVLKSANYSKFLVEQIAFQKKTFEEKRKKEMEKIMDGKGKKKKATRGRSSRGKKRRVEEEEKEEEAPVSAEVAEGGILKLDLFKGTLRDYQIEGVQWLTQLYAASTSGILGDEMGLGKTIQIIAYICHMASCEMRSKPYLIVVPLSTLTNWVCEFDRFAPSIPYLIFHGDEKQRNNVLKHARHPVQVGDAGFSMRPVLLTTYETVVRDIAKLRSIVWTSVIVDEGHRLKNHEACLSKAMRGLKTGNRYLLTGTPLQNNLTELWSLLNFLMPEVFTQLDVFSSWFDPTALAAAGAERIFEQEEKEKRLITKFHEIILPFMLRRTKADCELSLPPKREILVKCNMTAMQLKLHDAIMDYTIGDLANEMQSREEDEVEFDAKGRPVRKSAAGLLKMDYSIMNEKSLTKYYAQIQDIMSYRDSKSSSSADIQRNYQFNIKTNPMMQLRKVSAHPFLLAQPLDPYGQPLIDEQVVESCGKMKVLDRMLSKLLSEGHKVLIFSNFVIMLDVIGDYMHFKNIKCSRLDGSMSLADRAEQIKSFNEDPTVNVFLLSTRAGGLGLNLMAADTVIIYDSDWNPQADLQAQDRAHRIGQTKPVLVFRLVTLNTVEEVIMARAAAKRKLEMVILGTGDYKSKSRFSKTEEKDMLGDVRNMLKNINRALVYDSDANSFTDEQLARMLDRSALSSQPSKSELTWKHEYVGPQQAKKKKIKESQVAPAVAAEAPKSESSDPAPFEVLVECDADGGVDL